MASWGPGLWICRGACPIVTLSTGSYAILTFLELTVESADGKLRRSFRQLQHSITSSSPRALSACVLGPGQGPRSAHMLGAGELLKSVTLSFTVFASVEVVAYCFLSSQLERTGLTFSNVKLRICTSLHRPLWWRATFSAYECPRSTAILVVRREEERTMTWLLGSQTRTVGGTMRLLLVSAVLLLLFTAAAPTAADMPEPEAGGGPQVSPLNPDFEAYLENPPDVSYGYVPPTMDLSHVEASLPAGAETMAFVSRFDWRDQGKVTSVKNQNPCGTCWTFGTTAALESAALIAEGVTYDFSEQSVALCVDRSWTYLYDDTTDPCMAGGNSYKASDVFIKKGAVQETCSPYTTSTLNCDGSCLCDNCGAVKTVSGFRLVTDDGTQENIIKNALTNHGPLVVSFYHDSAYQYSDPTWGTIYDYYPSPDQANHCVLIVGWDDAVPHPNPSHAGTGAWIIKNSWGTGHGNNGYGYLAYDSSHTTEIAYLQYKNHNSSEELLYWDEAGFVGWRGWEDSTWMANVFTAPQSGDLTHVEFWTAANNLAYEIYVWSGAFGGQLAHQTGSSQELGYYSVPLNSPLSFTSGQRFTVGVKVTGYVPVERNIPDTVAATIQSNVSFIRHTEDQSWMDLADVSENACLRARMSGQVVSLTTSVYLPVVFKRVAIGPPPSPSPTPTEESPGLVNGDFEDGPTGWTEYSAQGWDLIRTAFPGSVTAHSGSWAVWLGGDYGNPYISFIQQQVTVPPSKPYLAYWHWIASEDLCGWDFGGVIVDGMVVDQYDLCEFENTGGWVRHTVNLTAYAGQSISLQIRAETDESYNSNLFLDDVSFQASASATMGHSQVRDPANAVPKSSIPNREGIDSEGAAAPESLFR